MTATDLPTDAGPRSRALASGARIFDLGYRRYTGPRLGVRGAFTSVMAETIRRAVGLRRSGWAKVLPILTIVLAYLPAIVFVGITIFLKTRDNIPSVARQQVRNLVPTYGDYYGFIWAAVAVFAAFVAPEVLCPDRRSGMLGLYLASPLTRTSYLLAKLAAVGAVLAVVTMGPPLLILVARTINSEPPNDFGASGFPGVLQVLAQVVVAGLITAVLPTALSLAISSLTTRRVVASAMIALVLFGGVVVTSTIIGIARGTNAVFLLNLLYLPFEIVYRVFGERGHVIRQLRPPNELGIPVLVGAYLAWTALFLTILFVRYRRLEITR